MGGYNSGRWTGFSSKYTVEDCLTLDINELIKDGSTISRSGVIHWSRNSIRFASVGFRLIFAADFSKLELDYLCNKESVTEPIRLTTTPQPFGNQRYWMICPLSINGVSCGKRCYKLYQPPNSKYFGCRKCMDLTYQSCKESHKYDSMFASLAADMNLPFCEVKKALKSSW